MPKYVICTTECLRGPFTEIRTRKEVSLGSEQSQAQCGYARLKDRCVFLIMGLTKYLELWKSSWVVWICEGESRKEIITWELSNSS